MLNCFIPIQIKFFSILVLPLLTVLKCELCFSYMVEDKWPFLLISRGKTRTFALLYDEVIQALLLRVLRCDYEPLRFCFGTNIRDPGSLDEVLLEKL